METKKTPLDNQQMLQAAILGGSVAALTDALPFLNLINCLCCLGIAFGGVVAVFYLKSLNPGKIFILPEIIQIGLFSGIAGAFISFGFHYIVFQMIGNWQVEWITNMIEQMEDIPDIWEEMYTQLKSPEMQYFAGFSILIRSLVIFPIFTFLGALFTNRILSKNE